MTIRGDSFSSIAEAVAFTRHLLDGELTFNSTTRPTGTEMEKFIDRVSGVMNIALSDNGFTPSEVYANSTAKLACDDWVTEKVVKYVELTQRGTGYSDEEGSRTAGFSFYDEAVEFVSSMESGFVNIGITPSTKKSDGLAFTGLDVQSDRSDPDDTSLEQPFASRNQFDNES